MTVKDLRRCLRGLSNNTVLTFSSDIIYFDEESDVLHVEDGEIDLVESDKKGKNANINIGFYVE